MPADGSVQTTVGTGLNGPSGVAVDAAGNVYIADTNNNQLVEVLASGGQQVLDTEFSTPFDVAVDALGDIVVADTGHDRALELPGTGGPSITVAAGLSSPLAVAVAAPPASSANGLLVRLTATVQASPRGGLPTGSVTFTQNSTVLGTATLSKANPDTAHLNTTKLPVGDDQIVATYNGDSGTSPRRPARRSPSTWPSRPTPGSR